MVFDSVQAEVAKLDEIGLRFEREEEERAIAQRQAADEEMSQLPPPG